MSASVKAYFALKMIGDSVDAPHMVRAREAIRARGGASRSNVFTRMMLALFDFIPWRAVPVMPVEIMLLPKWFPFHLDKVSYWSRTVLVPLLVLQALKPRARNPKGIAIEELFLEPPRMVHERGLDAPYEDPEEPEEDGGDQRGKAEALIRSPVSHPALSDARKTMTGAISSGLPNLAPSGVADAPAFPASLPTNPLSLLPSVSTRPGATILTRMFRGPSSLANAIVRVSTAPLLAA